MCIECKVVLLYCASTVPDMENSSILWHKWTRISAQMHSDFLCDSERKNLGRNSTRIPVENGSTYVRLVACKVKPALLTALTIYKETSSKGVKAMYYYV